MSDASTGSGASRDEIGSDLEESFDGCFGCGPKNPKGLQLEFEHNESEVWATVVLDRGYAGYAEFVHGGVIATLLDEAQGWALLTFMKHYGVTRSLNVSYRRPAAVGRPVTVRAKLIEREEANIYLHSQLEDERGRLLASAEGHWVAVRRERALQPSNN